MDMRKFVLACAGLVAGGVFAAAPVYVDGSLADYAGHDGSSPEKAFATIQEGVDAAEAGAVVHVAPGVYSNGVTAATSNFAACRVYIAKNVTLKGAGRDVTHIVGALADTGNKLGAGAVGGIVVSSAANQSRIEGFTIRGCGDSKKSNGANGAGTAVCSLKTGGSLKMADRPWIVDCAVSNIHASVGAVSYVNAARTIFMDCRGYDFASVGDYSDFVHCIVAHQKQDGNRHTFRGNRTSAATGNRIVNCTVVDASQSVNLMSTSGAYYLQNSIVDYGGAYPAEIDGCVLAQGQYGIGNADRPVSNASTNETATSCFSTTDKVIASSVLNDFRLLAPATLISGSAEVALGSPALNRGRAANLEAFPEEFRWKDVYGNPVVPDAEGRIHAGAVQATMTPVAGFTVDRNASLLRVEGRSLAIDVSRTTFLESWPTLLRLEMPAKDEMPSGTNPFFAFSMQNDGVENRYVFPDSNERLPFVPAPGRIMVVQPYLATHVVYADRAAENGDANAGSGTAAAPYARIQKAVNSVPADAGNKTVVYVAPGVYDCDRSVKARPNPDCRIDLTRTGRFRLIATAGAERTVIPGAGSSDPAAVDGCLAEGAVRCVNASGYDVALQGFTLTGGRTAGAESGVSSGNSYGRGGALWCNNAKTAWLVECIVTNNAAYYGGAAFANGNAVKCRFADNHVVGEGAVFDLQNSNGHWMLSSCVVDETTPGTRGTVFLQPPVDAKRGFCVQSTVHGNAQVPFFGSNAQAFFFNTILCGGKDQALTAGYRRFQGDYVWNWTFDGGSSNKEGNHYYTVDPQFVDEAAGDYHLYASSPAYGGGDAWTKLSEPGTTWTKEQAYQAYYRLLACDMDGNFPLFVNGNPSAGAYQFAPRARLNVVASHAGVTTSPAPGIHEVDPDEPVTVTAAAGARDVAGIVVDGVFHEGEKSVTFVPRALSDPSCTVTVVASTNWYVDAVGGNDANTGWTAATACRTMASVLARADAGDVVTALPGVYAEGSSLHTNVVYYYTEIKDGVIELPSRAVVPDGVTLVSRDGPEATVIKGEFGPDARGCGEGAVRCVLLGKGAVLKGFTVTGGGTLTGSTEYMKEFFDNVSAGGILSADIPASGGCGSQPKAKGYAENCIISNNASQSIGGAFFGSYVNCLFTGNRGGALREPHYMYGCVVGGNYDVPNQACYQPYYVDSCTFLGTDVNPSGQPAPSVYCYPGSSYWVLRNSLFLGSKASTLKWVFNCRFAHESGLANRGDGKHCWEDVVVDPSLAVDADYRPVWTNAAVDAWKDGSASVSNAFHYATPAEYLRDVDVSGGQRVYNGAMDIGAGECDWRARYASVLGGGNRHRVASATPGVVEADGVRIADGEAVACTFRSLRAGARQAEWQVALPGSGTLTASVNGGAPVEVPAGAFLPELAAGTNEVVFTFKGDGAAVLTGFTSFDGTVLLFR